MRRAFHLAGVLAALAATAPASRAQTVSHDYYFSTTIGQFLQSCQNNDDWCRSTIAPRIESEAYRFCVPSDHAAASDAVVQWLRAHQNDTLVDNASGYSQPATSEYLAKGVRTAMDALWGEMGKACPSPDSTAVPEGTDVPESADDEDYPF